MTIPFASIERLGTAPPLLAEEISHRVLNEFAILIAWLDVEARQVRRTCKSVSQQLVRTIFR